MTISSPGIGSNGLDVNAIVTKLVAVESQPVTLLQKKGSQIQSTISSWGTVKSQLSAIQDAASALLDKSAWASRTVSSSNSSAVSGAVTTGALAGNYSVSVTQLAQSQTTLSSGITSGSAIGSAGRLDIQVGQWSGSTFTQGSGSTVSVTVNATDTLSDIATRINGSNAGVSASVVTSGGQDKLVVRGANTGDSNGFQIQAFDSGGTAITDGTTGAGKLAYASNGTSIVGMGLSQAAKNSAATVDGVAVSSTNNQITGAVSGLTLNLQQVTTSPVTVSVAADTTTTSDKVSAFVTAYNQAISAMRNLTKYDPSTKASSPLQGDSTAIGLQNALRQMVVGNGPASSSYSSLSAVGISMQQDGTLAVNSTKLNAAITSNPSNLESLFDANGGSTTTNGIARRIRDFAMAANNTGGSVSNRTSALQTALTRNSTDVTKMQDRIAVIQARLYKQYNSLDTNLTSLNSLSSLVNQQITTWNKSSG
ncbi:flagellar filament capping protein FliD [Curvibacter gracilis]|uniref:flagellar filament capping protein FliD n=1 Tax=Curvibacter gracilis TaxID=230310 RepID=UPI000482F631|nr:flagellar filament capping protein FliD [Curvibacter gracilis]